jgi:alpha-tubulin suppressor-like RCC1 family protein
MGFVARKTLLGRASTTPRINGFLYAWGNNSSGQIGAPLPEALNVPAEASWTAVSCGSHTVAIRSDGLLFTWGGNSHGQLGDGTRVNKSSPVQIGTSTWTAVSLASKHTLAIRSDGSLFTWGRNNYGQLGDHNCSVPK